MVTNTLETGVNEYEIGDLVRLSGRFTDADGAPANPTSVVVKIHLPDGTIETLATGSDETGLYRADYSAAISGLHTWMMQGTGTIQRTKVRKFFVRNSVFAEAA